MVGRGGGTCDTTHEEPPSPSLTCGLVRVGVLIFILQAVLVLMLIVWINIPQPSFDNSDLAVTMGPIPLHNSRVTLNCSAQTVC
eukprot:3359948-Rhodomonas_salina.2